MPWYLSAYRHSHTISIRKSEEFHFRSVFQYTKQFFHNSNWHGAAFMAKGLITHCFVAVVLHCIHKQ